MLDVPTDKRELLTFTNEVIEQCRVSVGGRASQCRGWNRVAETGKWEGDKSLINMMNAHLERSATHLYSPVELKFNVDFEALYPKYQMERAHVAANVLTRDWERSGTANLFGRGVYEALKYGWCGMKQWCQTEGVGKDEHVTYHRKLVLPWQFGVYNEAENDINRQPALCETVLVTLPEVWRRIWHLPGAKKLYERIQTHAQSGTQMSEMTRAFHQVLSTSQINTTGISQTLPGGVVNLGNDANTAVMGPVVSAPTVQMHELWVQGETDYVTIIMVEPDIIVAPTIVGAGAIARSNLLIKNSRLQPYRTIQPNEVTNWFWGRSELVDLVEAQGFLSGMCDDAKRLIGLQIDKFLGLIGETGMSDEIYGQARLAGYLSMPQGSSIADLTPKFPPELLPMIQFVIESINMLGSFPEIMQGKGEAGVRAGVHAETLLKTASPTLRDRSLLVEQQCAEHADLSLSILEAKDPRFYWTNGETAEAAEQTKFLLSQLPDDWRVSVDSHRSSPIFTSETEQLIMAAFKLGIVDDEYVLDNMGFPNKEAAKLAARERKKAKAAELQRLLQDYPEVGEKLALQMVKGGKK
jgi:hypothetical protein